MLKRKMFQRSLILGVVILTIIISGCTDQNNQAQQAVQITELEKRYQSLEDVEEIKDLKARYFRFIDEKNGRILPSFLHLMPKLKSMAMYLPAGKHSPMQRGLSSVRRLRFTTDICPRLI